eukprot:5746667-Amphidinium_carterae.2
MQRSVKEASRAVAAQFAAVQRAQVDVGYPKWRTTIAPSCMPWMSMSPFLPTKLRLRGQERISLEYLHGEHTAQQTRGQHLSSSSTASYRPYISAVPHACSKPRLPTGLVHAYDGSTRTWHVVKGCCKKDVHSASSCNVRELSTSLKHLRCRQQARL